jgi:hypothetical protein
MVPAFAADDGGAPHVPAYPADSQRAPFESDRAFPGFIGPISNPVLAKDPRSLTEARALFASNWFPHDHPFSGGDVELYAVQLRLALTERLTFIADKDGYASLYIPGTGRTSGWVNMAAGLKYTFVRDVENQFLVAGGFMYEPAMGDARVFQNQGGGLFTVFGTMGKEFGSCNHVLVNGGYQMPVDISQNSQFFYTSLHLDRQLFGWFYPLVELNWFHYTASGDRGIPAAVGEGDGLLNIGTSGVAGTDMVTVAVGAKAVINCHLQTGFAYETPISNRENLLGNRLLFEMIFRY